MKKASVFLLCMAASLAAYGCVDEEPSQPTPDCVAGETKCSDDASTLLTCTNGVFKEKECAKGSVCGVKEGKAECKPVEQEIKCNDDEELKDGECVKKGEDKAECTGSVKKCSDDKKIVLTCTDGKYLESKNCTAEETCQDGECVPVGEVGAKCTGNASKCSEDKAVVLICDGGTFAEGKFCPPEAPCKLTADGADCVAPVESKCEDGDAKCEGEFRYVCSGGAFVLAACEPGTSCEVIDEKVTCSKAKCEEGATKCSEYSSDLILGCVNGEWKEVETCANACRMNEGKAGCGECSGEESVCNIDGVPMKCEKGFWKAQAPCEDEKVCKLGNEGAVCVGQDESVCENGTQKCSVDGTSVLSCKDGQFENIGCLPSETCSYSSATTASCVALHPCEVGEERCNETFTGVLTCNKNGTFDTDECYTDRLETCRLNEETKKYECYTELPPECEEEAVQCDAIGRSIQVCKRGKWITQAACEQNESCALDASNKPACVECQGNGKACSADGVTVYKCIQGKWEELDTCKDGKKCTATSETEAACLGQLCKAGDPDICSPDLSARLVCNGTEYVPNNCEANKVCTNNGKAVTCEPKCEPGTSVCTNDQFPGINTCQANGTWLGQSCVIPVGFNGVECKETNKEGKTTASCVGTGGIVNPELPPIISCIKLKCSELTKDSYFCCPGYDYVEYCDGKNWIKTNCPSGSTCKIGESGGSPYCLDASGKVCNPLTPTSCVNGFVRACTEAGMKYSICEANGSSICENGTLGSNAMCLHKPECVETCSDDYRVRDKCTKIGGIVIGPIVPVDPIIPIAEKALPPVNWMKSSVPCENHTFCHEKNWRTSCVECITGEYTARCSDDRTEVLTCVNNQIQRTTCKTDACYITGKSGKTPSCTPPSGTPMECSPDKRSIVYKSGGIVTGHRLCKNSEVCDNTSKTPTCKADKSEYKVDHEPCSYLNADTTCLSKTTGVNTCGVTGTYTGLSAGLCSVCISEFGHAYCLGDGLLPLTPAF